MQSAPIDVDPETVKEATAASFPLPGALSNCTKAARRCVDHRKFRFTIDQPRHGRIVKVAVFVNGKRKLVRRGHRIRQVTLRRLPRKRFKVRIVATASNGQRTISVRTYRGCRKSKPRTHVVRPHRH
jgi:hypothetical protein